MVGVSVLYLVWLDSSSRGSGPTGSLWSIFWAFFLNNSLCLSQINYFFDFKQMVTVGNRSVLSAA